MVCESQVYDDYIIAIQVYFTFLFYCYCDFLFLFYFISLFITNTRVTRDINDFLTYTVRSGRPFTMLAFGDNTIENNMQE